MKLKTKFLMKEVMGMHVAVAVGNKNADFNGVIRLENESTRRMFELLQSEHSIKDIIRIMMEEYDVDEHSLFRELIKLIDQLDEYGLISEE